LGSIIDGRVGRLVITHKGQLLRCGAEWVFAICEAKNVEEVILNQGEDSAFEEDLAKDVLEIITLFSARLYGNSWSWRNSTPTTLTGWREAAPLMGKLAVKAMASWSGRRRDILCNRCGCHAGPPSAHPDQRDQGDGLGSLRRLHGRAGAGAESRKSEKEKGWSAPPALF